MNKKELEAFAKLAAKGIKTPEDVTEFSQMLKKITVEAALNAEWMSILATKNTNPLNRIIAAMERAANA